MMWIYERLSEAMNFVIATKQDVSMLIKNTRAFIEVVHKVMVMPIFGILCLMPLPHPCTNVDKNGT